MANLGYQYDATNGQAMEDRDVLPAGEYVAMICKSEVREAKNNPNNRYVNLEFEVSEGGFQGRRFWTTLNLWNVNTQAVEFAQRELNSICHAIGKLRVSDTEELHGIPMRVKIGFWSDRRGCNQNLVTGYKPLNSVQTARTNHGQNTGQPVAGHSQSPADSTPPWNAA